MSRGHPRSFFAASRLLPAHVRRPAFGLYAFCRLSDDVVDLEGGSAPALARLRQRLARAHRGQPLPGHAIPLEVPQALLEGLEWDAQGRRYRTLDDLQAYAARVAGTAGVMMTLSMGTPWPRRRWSRAPRPPRRRRLTPSCSKLSPPIRCARARAASPRSPPRSCGWSARKSSTDMESYGWLSEGLFSFVVRGLAVWRWISVRRALARRKAREREALRPPSDSL